VSYPFLGMTDENRVRLQAMVRSLLPSARVSVAKNSAGSVQAGEGSLPVIVNPVAALQSVVEFFEVHPVLSKEEFLRTIRKSQSSPK
jgi:hypothetical protein